MNLYYGLGNETEYDTSNKDTYEISDNQTEIFPCGESTVDQSALAEPYAAWTEGYEYLYQGDKVMKRVASMVR